MEQAYGRCDAIRMQDTSGEISGPDSYMHAKSNRRAESLVRLQSCEHWPGNSQRLCFTKASLPAREEENSKLANSFDSS